MAQVLAGSPADPIADSELQFETTLISLVKFFPCIYDPCTPEYHDVQQNKVAWYKLSNSLKKSVMECINKWYALMQIYLCVSKRYKTDHRDASISWCHYKAMTRLRIKKYVTYKQLMMEKPPFMYSKPTPLQKEALVKQMEMNRLALLNVHVSIEQKQKIWLQIAQVLNSLNAGVNMPMIKWQKYWCEIKHSVINIKHRQNWTKQQAEGKFRNVLEFVQQGTPVLTTSDPVQFDEDELRVFNFFTLKPSDSLEVITAALCSNTEIDFDSGSLNLNVRCKRCNTFMSVVLNQEYCEPCSKIRNKHCDICAKIFESDLTTFNLKFWSPEAKRILPPFVSSFASLSACAACVDEIKKQAGKNWKACRICESYVHSLDNLFSNENEVLRKAFTDATSITFKETDGLPSFICKVCKVQMQQFNNFYLKFNRVQSRLRNIQDEFFIGVPGIVLTKSTACKVTSCNAINKALAKSALKSSTESGNKEQTNNIKTLTTPAGVLVTPITNLNDLKITKTQGNQVHTSPTDSFNVSNASKKYTRVVKPQSMTGVMCSIPQGNVTGPDKPNETQVVNTANAKPQDSPNRNVLTYKVMPPKSSGRKMPVLPTGAKIITPKFRIVANSTTSTPPPVSKTANPSANTSNSTPPVNKTASHSANSPNSMELKVPFIVKSVNARKSGTPAQLMNTTSGTQPKKKLLPVLKKVSLATPSPTSITTVKTIKLLPKAKQTVPQKAEEETGVKTAPTVFQIPDDMFDPNSPPAFCIPKIVKVQIIPAPNAHQVRANTEVEKIQVPPPVVSSSAQQPGSGPGPVVTPNADQKLVEIKTEVIDLDEPTDEPPAKRHDPDAQKDSHSNQVENRNPPNGSCGGISFQKAFETTKSSPLGQPQTVFEKSRMDSAPSDCVRKAPQIPTQQTPAAPSAGNKRPRKYWGAVDEFHIPSKVTNQSQPVAEIPPMVTIKTEEIEEDRKDVILSNDECSNMFYSDSFELGSVSLDAHVTDVLTHMIAQHQSCSETEFRNIPLMDAYKPTETLSKNSESQDRASVSQPQSECKPKSIQATEKVEITKNKKLTPVDKDSDESEPVKPVIQAPKKRGRPRLIKNPNDISKDTKISKSSSLKCKRFRLKKLCVKLKRSKSLQKLELSSDMRSLTARSCTMSRKSMRFNRT